MCLVVPLGQAKCVENIAEWRTSNGQNYLYITAADEYNLGVLEGQKLTKEILTLKQILIQLAPAYGLSYTTLVAYAANYLPYIAEVYMEEFEGIVAGVNSRVGNAVTLDDILVQNVWYDILYGLVMPSISPLACTGIAAENIRNAHNHHVQAPKVVIGQNFDFTAAFLPCLSWVEHHCGHKPGIFGLRLGASLNLPLAQNTFGVVSTINLVLDRVLGGFQTPFCIRSRTALNQGTNVRRFLAAFYLEAEKESFGWNQLVADKRHFVGVSSVPTNQLITHDRLQVKTNTYTTNDWQVYLLDPVTSKDRQLAAENLATAAYADNKLTESELMTILSNQTAGIARPSVSNPLATITCAFMTNSYFGLGLTGTVPTGVVPI